MVTQRVNNTKSVVTACSESTALVVASKLNCALESIEKFYNKSTELNRFLRPIQALLDL